MSNDSDLQKSVMAELTWEPSVTAAHIGVTAKNGVIALSGHVESYAQKHAAEVAVTRVKGVKAVAEELEVRLPVDAMRSDDGIATAAVERLSWDVSVPRDAVKVKVEKGWVTLSGQVDWYFQKDLAGQDIRRLVGVKGLSNLLTIKPKVDAKHISADITHALHRTWFYEPNKVSVSASGGHVKLSGHVETYYDRETAENTAWAAAGVTGVENDIVIN